MKGIFLTDDRYEVSAQIEKTETTHRAYFAIEDKAVKSPGHELAIGIENGRVFLQVCSDGKVEHVDLMKLAKAANALTIVS